MMKKILAIAGLVYLIFISPQLHAQAYDGSDDRKIFIGAVQVGHDMGVEFQTDDGIGELISYGGKIIYLINKIPDGTDEFDRASFVFSNLDVSLYLRFHFSSVLELNEKIDPYLGLDVSLKTLGAHAGFKYNFSETVGVYAQVGRGFTGSFFGPTADNGTSDDFINRFAKKNNISVGITFNIFDMSGYRY